MKGRHIDIHIYIKDPSFVKGNHKNKLLHRLSISFLRASERRPDIAGIVGIDDILDTGVSAASKNSQTDNKAERVESGQCNVLFACIPLALLDMQEPEERGEVEGEA